MSRPRKDQQLDIPRQAIQETIRLLDERDAHEMPMSQRRLDAKPPRCMLILQVRRRC